MNLAPGPSLGGPFSISQDEGASTAVTGIFVFSRAVITEGNGSRRGPENENPVKLSYGKVILGMNSIWGEVTKYGIDYMISFLEGGLEVCCERDGEVLELGC